MTPTCAALALEQFYLRTFNRHIKERIGSMLLMAGLLIAARTLTWRTAGAWISGYALCELAILAWWRRVGPRLHEAGKTEADRLSWQMIMLCALTMTEVVLPFFPLSATRQGEVIAIIAPAGVMMVTAALHTMNRRMFFFMALGPAAALMINMWREGDVAGSGAWLTFAMGLCYVINARSLSAANADGYENLIQARIDANRANAAKSTFLATLSHEIRTPLNGVLGMAQAMEAGEMTADQRDRLGVIQRSGAALLSLLNDVLDMSKIEAGKVQLECLDFDLHETLATAAEPFRPIAEAKGVAFEVDLPVNGIYRGDPTRLRQIIYNLLSNAVKFTTAGTIKLAAKAGPGGVIFTVTDTGIGMAQDTVEHLFSKFAQADASTTRRFGGTGLGLAISRDLAHLMGGDIGVVSRRGAGTTFSVELPLERVGEAVMPPRETASAAVIAPEHALRVLIAEDNPTNQLVLTSLLAALGDQFETRLTANGRETVEAFTERAFDVILMDVNMPEMDGLAATRAIRQIEARDGRARTPIIALTANAMSHQVAEHLAAGMDAHVAKPLRLENLLAALNAVLDPGDGQQAA